LFNGHVSDLILSLAGKKHPQAVDLPAMPSIKFPHQQTVVEFFEHFRATGHALHISLRCWTNSGSALSMRRAAFASPLIPFAIFPAHPAQAIVHPPQHGTA
jgi:hypothetical protein